MNFLEFRQQVLPTIRRVANEMDMLLTQCCENQQVTLGQCRILFCLEETQPVTVSALSRQMGIAPGNLSPLCKRMEGAGLLLRRRGQEDERVVEILLTDKGRSCLEKIKNQINLCYAPVLEELSSQQLEQIAQDVLWMEQLLKKIHQTQQNTVTSSKMY